jgi:hypothetical protein
MTYQNVLSISPDATTSYR